MDDITKQCTHCGAEVNNDNGCPTGCDDGAIFNDGLEAELVTDKFFNILKMIEDLEKINSGFKNAALEVLQKRITT